MSAERDAGIAAIQRGDMPNAIISLEQAALQDPGDYDTQLYLGAAYGQSKRNDDAIRAFTRAVHIQPGNAQARYNVGIALERGGWAKEALNALQEAVTLQPNYPKALEAISRLQQSGLAAMPTTAVVQQTAYAAAPTEQPGLANYASPVPAGAYAAPSQPAATGLYGSAPAAYGAPQAPPATGYAATPPPTYGGGMQMPAGGNTTFTPMPIGATSAEPNLAAAIAVAVILFLACGIGFGYASVAVGLRIPYLTLAIGYVVGYAVRKASGAPDLVPGIAAGTSAVGATLLGLYIMWTAGIFFSPIAFIIMGFAGYRAFTIASGGL